MEAFKKRDKGNEGENETRGTPDLNFWELLNQCSRAGGACDVAHVNGKLCVVEKRKYFQNKDNFHGTGEKEGRKCIFLINYSVTLHFHMF